MFEKKKLVETGDEVRKQKNKKIMHGITLLSMMKISVNISYFNFMNILDI